MRIFVAQKLLKTRELRKGRYFFKEASDDSVAEDARGRFKIEVFHIVFNVLTNQLKDCFKYF